MKVPLDHSLEAARVYILDTMARIEATDSTRVSWEYLVEDSDSSDVALVEAWSALESGGFVSGTFPDAHPGEFMVWLTCQGKKRMGVPD